MALKRPGVRASSAPYDFLMIAFLRRFSPTRSSQKEVLCVCDDRVYQRIESTVTAFGQASERCCSTFWGSGPKPFTQKRGKRLRSFCQIALGLLLAVSAAPLIAQTGSDTKPKPSSPSSDSSQLPGQATARVALLVLPQSANAARVALTYNVKVGHKQVRREVEALARFAGGQVAGPVKIRDYSLNPDNPRRFPVTTSAEFDLLASQFQDAAPHLLPYIQAFRIWGSIDVLFHLPGANATPVVSRFQSQLLNIWFYQDNGVYRYHAEVAGGKEDLPLPSFATNAPANQSLLPGETSEGAQAGTAPVPASRFPLMLILAGSGLICGVLLYFLAVRRSMGKISLHQ